MGVHFVQAFFPEVEGPEATEILERQLGPAGYRVEERLALGEGEIFPALGVALKRHPGAGAFILFARPGEALPPATLLDTCPAPDRRWDPALVRALSRGIGGYAVALESWRGREEYRLGVFYAGHTVELDLFDGRRPPSQRLPDEEWAQAGYLRHWTGLADGVDLDLGPAPAVRPQAWIVRDLRPLAPPAPLDAGSEPALGRAAFGPVEEAAFREVFEQLAPSPPPSLRWLARTTYGAEVPFVLVDRDGALDDALVAERARRLDVFVAAAELSGPGRSFRWLAGHGAALQGGLRRGAFDLEALWRGFSVCLGASPSCVRWPRAPSREQG